MSGKPKGTSNTPIAHTATLTVRNLLQLVSLVAKNAAHSTKVLIEFWSHESTRVNESTCGVARHLKLGVVNLSMRLCQRIPDAWLVRVFPVILSMRPRKVSIGTKAMGKLHPMVQQPTPKWRVSDHHSVRTKREIARFVNADKDADIFPVEFPFFDEGFERHRHVLKFIVGVCIQDPIIVW